MPNVVLCGWQSPLDKVGLNQLLRARCGLSLAEAKKSVDLLLDGEDVTVRVADGADAALLVQQAAELGAKTRVIQDDAAQSRN